ncbi:MAG TPA: hypothetical protein ENG95_00705 [Nitrospirae bacterium]|nr:DRTGG domain protein [bacterium BMS3Abin10]GBE38010.1 DRTGG domain protein [bacterium BMS3Bbin08]HDH00238.1 hypothetical protein [Nitrospirota bacterium]HDH50632.1 hypothetical protein [Nitrospirota bacterium]HDO25146.1 hypothetical protein [Nitrospirota bacterium]
MILGKISEILEAAVVTNPGNLDKDIKWAFSTDLLSNVLFYFIPDSLLLTGLIHPQVVRAAEVANIDGIVFVQGKKPEAETIALANEKKITLLVTPFCMYTASGKLYQAGLEGFPEL